LHNYVLVNLFSSRNEIRAIRSRRMRLTECVARVVVTHSKARDHLEDLDVDDGIILKWILNKYAVRI
jgi:hypothetical protein